MPVTRRRMDRSLKVDSYYWINDDISKRSLLLAIQVWQASITRSLSRPWVKVSGRKVSGTVGGMIRVRAQAKYRYISGVSRDLIDGAVRDSLLRALSSAEAILKPWSQPNALEEEFFSRGNR